MGGLAVLIAWLMGFFVFFLVGTGIYIPGKHQRGNDVQRGWEHAQRCPFFSKKQKVWSGLGVDGCMGGKKRGMVIRGLILS